MLALLSGTFSDLSSCTGFHGTLSSGCDLGLCSSVIFILLIRDRHQNWSYSMKMTRNYQSIDRMEVGWDHNWRHYCLFTIVEYHSCCINLL